MKRLNTVATKPACCTAGPRRDAFVASNVQTPVGRAKPGRLVKLCGGRFRIGTNDSPLPQDGEAPSRLVEIKPFAIDPHAVTNSWFSEFSAATGAARTSVLARYGRRL